MLSFYMTGNVVGLFIPVSPQIHENTLHYNVMTAMMSLGDKSFRVYYTFIGPLSYIQSVDQTMVTWCLTVIYIHSIL